MQQVVDSRSLLEAPQSRRRIRLRRTKGRSTPGYDRLIRGVRRQTLVFFCVVLAAVAGGALVTAVTGASPVMILAWAALGLVAGVLVAAAREFARNTVGGWTDIRRNSGFLMMGAAPDLSPGELRDLAPDMRSPLGAMVYQPASRFATAFRDLAEEIADSQLVAFLGSVPNEGATTAALCVALSARQQGKRVLVMDCDLRRRSLTRLLNSDPAIGALEVAWRPKSWRQVVEYDHATGLFFIPAARSMNPWRGIGAAPGLRILFDRLREHYDLIVLDCPPATTNSDGAMIARSADRCVIVTAWDETPVAALRATCRLFRERTPIETGVYLNRAPSHQGAGVRQSSLASA